MAGTFLLLALVLVVNGQTYEGRTCGSVELPIQLKQRLNAAQSLPLDAEDLLAATPQTTLNHVVELRKLLRDLTKSLGDVAALSVDEEANQLVPDAVPIDLSPDCSVHRTCQPCFDSGCAWCLGERVCVRDEAWMCQGEQDQVGKRVGAVKVCPTPEDIAKQAEERRRKIEEEEQRQREQVRCPRW